MKWLLSILVMFFALYTQADLVRASFMGGSDVPLMEGLTVYEADEFSFDTPAGQIVGFIGRTDKSAKEVREFYHEALTELGWRKKSANRYVREQDELELQVKPLKKGTQVKIQCTFPNVSAGDADGRVTDKWVGPPEKDKNF